MEVSQFRRGFLQRFQQRGAVVGGGVAKVPVFARRPRGKTVGAENGQPSSSEAPVAGGLPRSINLLAYADEFQKDCLEGYPQDQDQG